MFDIIFFMVQKKKTNEAKFAKINLLLGSYFSRNSVKRFFFRFGFRPDESILAKVTGVIHIGANIGQDRNLYAQYGLSVVWIEPVKETYQILIQNIKDLNNQFALNFLVSDRDGELVPFKITNNNASSSMFKLKLHSMSFPEVSMEREIELKSFTLPTIIDVSKININEFQLLVMDVQGAELKILQGCAEILKHFKYIKFEAADYEAYENGCVLSEVVDFVVGQGFREVSKKRIHEHYLGSYFDCVYERGSVV